jgi:hypothetical protein
MGPSIASDTLPKSPPSITTMPRRRSTGTGDAARISASSSSEIICTLDAPASSTTCVA